MRTSDNGIKNSVGCGWREEAHLAPYLRKLHQSRFLVTEVYPEDLEVSQGNRARLLRKKEY